MDAKAIAQTTMVALEHGQYTAPEGNLSGLLATCLSGTQTYDPDDLARLREHVLAQPVHQQTTTFAVVNETTLQGCARLMASSTSALGAQLCLG